jgi:hypothetical protein
MGVISGLKFSRSMTRRTFRKTIIGMVIAGAFPVAAFTADFRSGLNDGRITYSGGANSTRIDATGTLVAAVTPRFNYSGIRRNFLRNNTMVGAVVGSPGTRPTNWTGGWTASSFGLQFSVVGVGVESGISYVDINIAGTSNAVTGIRNFFELTTVIPAAIGQAWNSSFYIRLIDGAQGNLGLTVLQTEYDSGGTALVNATSGAVTPTGAALNTQRPSLAYTTVNASTAFITSGLRVAGDGVSTYNVTLRIGMPQLEMSATATAVIATAGADASVADNNRGLLLEGSRTNSIRNNTMVGAVAGTPGGIPTNWFRAFNTTAGVTQSVAGIGTENGITYIDLRLQGTSVGAGSWDIFFEQVNGIAAAPAQAWSSSLYWKLAGGTTAGITNFQHDLYEYDAGSVFLRATVINGGATPLAALLINQRVGGSITTGASTAFVRPLVKLTIADATLIDITLRIGLPQLEQSATVTSVIQTSGAAVTRTTDVGTVTGANFSSWFNSNAGTFLFEGDVTSAGAVNEWIFTATDGSNNNYCGAFVTPALALNVISVSGGVTQAQIAPAGVVTAATPFSGTISYALNDVIGSLNGVMSANDVVAALPIGVSQLNLGVTTAGGSLNGHLAFIKYYPKRLSNSVQSYLST